MLYSLAANVAFARYPQAAGSAISEWFRRSFPDARCVKPGQPHLDVRRSLALLSGGRSLSPVERLWHLARISDWRLAIEPRPDLPASIRIIGVVRDPLEMLASLYAHRRRGDGDPTGHDSRVTAARERRFAEFAIWVINGRLPSYARFFDAGGPAWPNTRLIAFEDLAEGLARACREFGLDVAVDLPVTRAVTTARRGDLARLLSPEASAAVRRHFAWYHATYGHADHPAARRRRAPARVAA